MYCDRSPQISITWSSEEIHIPYVSPKDDKYHNYYPDFYVEYTDKAWCSFRRALIEIKPHYQRGYKVNKAKWAACEAYCTEQGLFDFHILTEKELF